MTLCVLLTLPLALQAATDSGAAQETNTLDDCERVEQWEELPLALPTTPQRTKSWNILLYCAADFSRGQGLDPLPIFARYVGAGPNKNVLVLHDPYSRQEGDFIYHIGHQECSGEITPVLDLGEAQVDKPETLEIFLRFAQEWFPSERTLLFMYGHGGGWIGACTDESSPQERDLPFGMANWLTPLEMRSALEAVGGVDALMFSAPCVMSALETAYELRDVTGLYVADEAPSGYVYWIDAVGRIACLLETTPDLDIEALGVATINAIRETTQKSLDDGIYSHVIANLPIIAALRPSRIGELASAIDAFAEAALALPSSLRDEVTDIRMRYVPQMSSELVDIYGLAESCQILPTLSEAASEVMQAVDETVIALVSPGALPQGDAAGISLYFPHPFMRDVYDRRGDSYLNYGLAFTTDTSWDELIETLLGSPVAP